MIKTDNDKLAMKRAEIIMKVNNGEITATEGAKVLGVSRKTYYEWEQKGLEGLFNALKNGEPGRPANKVDEEKDTLKDENERLKTELEVANAKIRIKELMSELGIEPVKPKKKPVKKKKRKKKSKK